MKKLRVGALVPCPQAFKAIRKGTGCQHLGPHLQDTFPEVSVGLAVVDGLHSFHFGSHHYHWGRIYLLGQGVAGVGRTAEACLLDYLAGRVPGPFQK